MKILSIGDKGKEVEEIQLKLKRLGYYGGKVDGDFGPITQKAIVHFQEDHLVTGCINNITYIVIQNEHDKIAIDTPIPKSSQDVIKTFGKIEYRDLTNGNIKITNDWAKDNIVKIDLPIVRKKWIHKKLINAFTDALNLIEEHGLANKIYQFGTWSPRHMSHNIHRPLSLHSWGIACDINWSQNRYGTNGNMHPDIINAFEKHGFSWGGRWKTKDPMHFEYYERYLWQAFHRQ